MFQHTFLYHSSVMLTADNSNCCRGYLQSCMFLTLNHLTSALVLESSHSKVTLSFSGARISKMGLEIMAAGSVKTTKRLLVSKTNKYISTKQFNCCVLNDEQTCDN